MKGARRATTHRELTWTRARELNLVDDTPLAKIIIFVFCCVGTVLGQRWPQDPTKLAKLENRCRTRSKLAPETNSRPLRDSSLVTSTKTQVQNGCLTANKYTMNSNFRRSAAFRPPGPVTTGSDQQLVQHAPQNKHCRQLIHPFRDHVLVRPPKANALPC